MVNFLNISRELQLIHNCFVGRGSHKMKALLFNTRRRRSHQRRRRLLRRRRLQRRRSRHKQLLLHLLQLLEA